MSFTQETRGFQRWSGLIHFPTFLSFHALGFKGTEEGGRAHRPKHEWFQRHQQTTLWPDNLYWGSSQGVCSWWHNAFSHLSLSVYIVFLQHSIMPRQNQTVHCICVDVHTLVKKRWELLTTSNLSTQSFLMRPHQTDSLKEVSLMVCGHKERSQISCKTRPRSVKKPVADEENNTV